MKYIVYVIIIACLLQESLVACRGGHGGGGGGRGGGGGSRGGSSRGGSSRGGSSYSGGGGRSYSGSSSSSRGGALDAWVYILLAFGLTSVIVIASLVLCFCCGKKSKNQSGVIISVPPDAKNGDCKFSAANNARCDDDNNNAKNNKVTGIQSETIDMSYLGTYNLDTNERGTRNMNRDPTVKTSYIDMSGLPNYFDVVNGATPQLNTSTLPKYSNVANGDTPQLKRTPKTPYSKGKRFVQYKKKTGVFIL